MCCVSVCSCAGAAVGADANQHSTRLHCVTYATLNLYVYANYNSDYCACTDYSCTVLIRFHMRHTDSNTSIGIAYRCTQTCQHAVLPLDLRPNGIECRPQDLHHVGLVHDVYGVALGVHCDGVPAAQQPMLPLSHSPLSFCLTKHAAHIMVQTFQF